MGEAMRRWIRVDMDIDKGIEWLRWGAAGCALLWLKIPELTQLLLIMMAVDVVFGLIIAIKKRDLSVSAASWGVTKKFAVLVLVGLAAVLNHYVQNVIEINLTQAASVFYLVPEMLSISRNAAELGVPVFSQFETVLDYFRNYSTPGAHDNPPAPAPVVTEGEEGGE